VVGIERREVQFSFLISVALGRLSHKLAASLYPSVLDKAGLCVRCRGVSKKVTPMVKLIFGLWRRMCLYSFERVKTCVRDQSNLDIRAGMMQRTDVSRILRYRDLSTRNLTRATMRGRSKI
jgi:hypothetical protein